MIRLISGDAPDLLGALADVRAAGDVPLVTDPRWPAAQAEAIAAAAGRAHVPAAAAWATLTSGSSGAPRIVLRSVSSWESSFGAVERMLGVGLDDTVLLTAPPASSLTLFSLAHALAGGPRPVQGWRCGGSGGADRVRETAPPTCFHGTPQGLRALLDTAAPPALRSALIGGSHLDPDLRARAAADGIRVVSYYGAAELSFVAVDEGEGLRPFPGAEVELRGGEVWVRSPFVALGYAAVDEASDIGPLRRDGEWASVGDRAEWVSGALRLLGRADDAILSASATIVPEEVEAVLRRVPGVRDAVVFGVARQPVGALVAALLEVDGSFDRDVLRAATREELAPTHRPRRWFAGELPRTASGKPARGEAARRAQAGEVRVLDV